MTPPKAPKSIAFINKTREEFLGNPTITSDKNASQLRPRDVTDSDVRFGFGSKYTASYSKSGAAVYDDEDLIASYNFGRNLVVDKPYRRKGIGYGLVYQWRTRFPDAPPATDRTKKSQALQVAVWDRIERELDGYKVELADWKENMSKVVHNVVLEVQGVYGRDLSSEQMLMKIEDSLIGNGLDVTNVDISPLLSNSTNADEGIEMVLDEINRQFNQQSGRLDKVEDIPSQEIKQSASLVNR